MIGSKEFPRRVTGIQDHREALVELKKRYGCALVGMREQEFVPLLPGEKAERVMCRMRSLGCSPCTGAVRSTADTVPKIIQELISVRQSERQLRIIDHDQDGSMEMKKREGYF